jgi:hypothetical protein
MSEDKRDETCSSRRPTSGRFSSQATRHLTLGQLADLDLKAPHDIRPHEGLPSYGQRDRSVVAVVEPVIGDLNRRGENAEPGKPGCYALQADGAGFEDVVVFTAAA